MKNQPTVSSTMQNLLDGADQVGARLHDRFRLLSVSSSLVDCPLDRFDLMSSLTLAAATIAELREELARRPEAPPLVLEEDDAPAPAAVACRHKWRVDSAGNGPPTCERCGKVKSAQGRPKGPPSATVDGVTKKDPPSAVLPMVGTAVRS
jgi:hypothetical protein